MRPRLDSFGLLRRAGATIALAGAMLVGLSCTENLPSGPSSFAANLAIVVTHDTLVVGDQNLVTAQATDGSGRIIQGLSFVWVSSDTSIGALRSPTANAVNVLGKHTGHATLTLTLPDSRFATTGVTRIETVVVGGVKVLTSHDSTLTAVNDTALAVAVGLIHTGGTLVNSPSQGIRWVHIGAHTTTVASGDTIRYIARSNGVDTLIATHDFCLIGAKCADTVFARVSQQLTLSLSAHAFLAWSFSDSVGPSVTLADRRGVGLAGTSVRFVPRTAADSAIVAVTPPLGTSNPATGQLATPLLVTSGNGAARVGVFAIGTDGATVIATDSVTATVRQVARRVAVEPLIATMTVNDSIPIRPVARDARGAPILDATLTVAPTGIPLTGIWAGPTAIVGASASSMIVPTLTGIALPSSNPGAPQITPFIDTSRITLLQRDTAIAGTTVRPVTVSALDSVAQPAAGKWVRFGTTFELQPDSVLLDGTGSASTIWFPKDSAMLHTLTALRGIPGGPATLADSAGRIVLRRSVLVVPNVPSALKSTVAVSPTTMALSATATVTIVVKDQFGNIVKTALTTDFALTSSGVGGGTFSGLACVAGTCTATYTPAAAGAAAVHVQIAATEILNSPIALTITP
jgi:hypothetical protein